MQRNLLWISIALGAVLGSFVAGPQLASLQSPSHQDHAVGADDSQVAEAATLPLSIDWHYKIKDKVGDAASGSSVKVDDQYIDAEIHCEICTKIEFTPGPQGRAGLAYAFDKIQDLSAAKSITFFVMGEDGGEKVKFKVGGKNKAASDLVSERPARGNDNGSDTVAGKKLQPVGLFKQEFAATTEEVVATNDWKKFAVDVEGLDLKSVSHPFGLEFEGKRGSQTQVIIIKHITYDTDPAVNPLAASNETVSLAAQAVSVDVIANATNATAPASMEFTANITGGQPPFSLQWDFGNGDELEAEQATNETDSQQVQASTFDEPGNYNVTVEVADSSNQTGSGSTEVQITEQGQNATNIQVSIEANATESEAPATIEFEVSAGDDDPDDFDYEWEFGDGEAGQGQNVTHTFGETGEYNVTANANGSDGKSGSAWIEIEVTEGAPQNDTSQEADVVEDSSNVSDTFNETEDSDTPANDTGDNTAPRVSAIEQILAYPGDDVILDASGSTDEDGDPITFNWVQSSGPEVEIFDENAATPRITIPEDIEQDEEIVIEVTASDNLTTTETLPVTITVDYVQAFYDAQEDDELSESVLVPEPQERITDWESDCEDLVECLSDGEEETFASAEPESSESDELVMPFEDLETSEAEEAEIKYVEVRVDASMSDEAGYLDFIVGEDGADELFTSDPISIGTGPDEFGEYRLLLEENPSTDEEWTASEVDELLAGVSHAGGQSDISASEISLVVVYETIVVEEPVVEEEVPEPETEEENNPEEEPADSETEEESQDSNEDPNVGPDATNSTSGE